MAAKRNPVAQYFRNIYDAVATTLLGMRLTAGYLVGKPVTLQYPEVKPEVPPGARGLHKFIEEQCMSCQQCNKVCPVDCISLEFVGRGKDSMVTKYDIDYQRCLFCNLCCEVCPTEAVVMTENWDLASYDREGCVAHLARPKSEKEIEAFEAQLAAKEAEKKRKLAEAAAAKKKAEEEKKAAEEAAEVDQ